MSARIDPEEFYRTTYAGWDDNQRRAFNELQVQNPNPQPVEQGTGDQVTTWADLNQEPITWAWQGWLPKGFVTMVVAGQGVGKSALALRVAACFLRGDPWPDGSKFTGETGAVLWCEAEAAQALNLERATRWGLPLGKIIAPLADGMEDFSLDNPDHINALTIKAYDPNIKLIVIDSISGAKANVEKDTEHAAVIKDLAALARDTGKPILITHHLRKRGMMDLNSVDLDRVRGSSYLTQPCRAVWAIDTPDPYNEKTKRFKTIKNNLAAWPQPIGVTIGDTLAFGDAPEEPKTEGPTERAIDLLMALLQSEPMKATSIQDEFDAAGISIATMKRAKAKLNIVSIKDSEGWKWSLPNSGGKYEN